MASLIINSASTVITLADWYHVPSKQQPAPACVNTPSDNFAVSILTFVRSQSEATLINGVGRAYNTTQVPTPAALAVVSVQYSKRHVLSQICW
jgi:hypothetical protein